LLPAGSWALQSGDRFLFNLGLFIRVPNDGDSFVMGGERVDPFTAGLNTAIALGSDPVRLFARLHGQCEIHCYVEGPNRAWLAGIIEEGRACGLYRDDMGWEAVIDLLRSRKDGPVVTSYSVTDSFPNADIGGATSETDVDAFYELPDAEQWARAIDGLRAVRAGRRLELRPDDWSHYVFGDGVNGLALRRWALAQAEDDKSAGLP
jgi:hypothetical protein